MTDPEVRRLKPEFENELTELLGPDEAGRLIYALTATDPATGVRLNPAKPVAEALFPEAERVEWCAEGLRLARRPQFTFMPELHAGAFYVQDPSSMILSEVARRLCSLMGRDNLRWLDACAAPGGKATAVAAALPADSMVVANEYVAQRAAVLLENVQKWGAANMAVTRSDTAVFRKMRAQFDVVAVDAPCSGEGMMRKDAEARAQWSRGLVEQCAALQREIIANVWEALRPGGFFVYSTCTYNREENEQQLLFMQETLGAEPVDLRLAADFNIPRGHCDALPSLRFMQHITQGEGLFLGVMRKPGEAEEGRKPGRKEPKKSPELPPQLKELQAIMPGFRFLQTEGGIYSAIPSQHEAFLQSLAKAARIIGAGIESGEVKGRDFVPSAALALAAGMPRLSEIYPEVELTREEALSYLRREAEQLPGACERAGLQKKGLFMPVYHGLRLGFAKHLGNRVNNLYPAPWRIRSQKA